MPDTDIVERLRARHSAWLANCRLPPDAPDQSNFSAAAAEITRLRALNAEAREVLRATRNELYWCAEQLKARGQPGVPGDTVDRVLATSAVLLSKAKE
jgi:hypothetical protein